MSRNMTGRVDVDKAEVSDESVSSLLPCGVVLFDDPKDASSGSAFLPNQATQRIRSLNDLKNDVLWVSNLSIHDDKIKHHPSVRSGWFFRLTLNEMAQDIGIQSSLDGQMEPDDAQRISNIATRALTIAALAYGWSAKEGVGALQELLLHSDIQKGLPRPPIPDARWRDSLAVAFRQSYQERSVPSWASYSWAPDSVFVTLRFNYVDYVKQLLDQPVPLGKKWTKLEESGVRLLDDPVAYCLDKPCFVRATVEWDNASSEIAALAAYGQAGKRKNAMRLWLSQPELVWLSKYATITISDIWIDQSGLGKLPKQARLPDLFESSPESVLSYSAHIAAYNHYQAISSDTWNRRTRSYEVSVWAAWIKALDRAFMFSVALAAHERGFYVASYGDGSLRLRILREQANDLMAFKVEQGFMYPDLTLMLNE